jgi:hypothetical protein
MLGRIKKYFFHRGASFLGVFVVSQPVLLYFNDRVKIAEWIRFGQSVVGVLLPPAVHDEAVAISAGGESKLGLPDAAVAHLLHRCFLRLPVIKVAGNLDAVGPWVECYEYYSIVYLVDAVIVGKLGVGIGWLWFFGSFDFELCCKMGFLGFWGRRGLSYGNICGFEQLIGGDADGFELSGEGVYKIVSLLAGLGAQDFFCQCAEIQLPLAGWVVFVDGLAETRSFLELGVEINNGLEHSVGKVFSQFCQDFTCHLCPYIIHTCKDSDIYVLVAAFAEDT